MQRWTSLVMFVVSVSLGQGQVLVVRDDRWAATSPAARVSVGSQVAAAERWLRRSRLPYRRVNVSAASCLVKPRSHP